MQNATLHLLSTRQLSRAADNLGKYKAALLSIQQRITSLEEMFEAHGVGKYAGKEYTVTVSYTNKTLILDQAAAKALLTPAQLAQCMKTRAGYYQTTVKEV